MMGRLALDMRAWVFRGLLALFCVVAWAGIASGESDSTIVTVEEDWELVIATSDPDTSGPQAICTMSPQGNISELYCTLELNHQTVPDFAPGGLQFELWNGEALITERRAPTQDVLVGYLPNPLDPTSQLLLDGSHPPNAVQVRVRKVSGLNGEVPLFFARALGIDGASMQAVATAALLTNVRGFRAPSSGENLGVLPFALDEETWIALVEDHVGTDDWTWNPQTGEVQPGGDGILEVNLFPQGTGSPGNRGTVDIGPSNNSTADLARQITDGITQDDLDYIGGKLELNDDGFLYLNGDTGISAGMKEELASIIGQPKTILIFREVTGNGNNATYTIVGFAGIRITDVKLTGQMSGKHVTIQPAINMMNGAIPATGDQLSRFVYSPVWLVR